MHNHFCSVVVSLRIACSDSKGVHFVTNNFSCRKKALAFKKMKEYNPITLQTQRV